ncbi:hypothetical protein [Delftia phage PhiW-14]|uniref:Uncharacterized protein n=1 Tax=Delftia phage PhiW-14 TaxID=665032 RepID=C9DGE8_BPW14|nr:hypothetical protein DP-phiW-14_gp178 [Delftia phage PhiW-14]ACV50199.1 hypothetical protein [Delftia phage PhiW-14]
MNNEYKQGWNLRVSSAYATNKQVRPFTGAGSKAKNDAHEDGFRACNSAFMKAVATAIEAGVNPTYPQPI